MPPPATSSPCCAAPLANVTDGLSGLWSGRGLVGGDRHRAGGGGVVEGPAAERVVELDVTVVVVEGRTARLAGPGRGVPGVRGQGDGVEVSLTETNSKVSQP